MCVFSACLCAYVCALICANTVPASEPGNRLIDARHDRRALESWQPCYFSLPSPSSLSISLLLLVHPHTSSQLSSLCLLSAISLFHVCPLPWHEVIAYGSSHNPILSQASRFLQDVNLEHLSVENDKDEPRIISLLFTTLLQSELVSWRLIQLLPVKWCKEVESVVFGSTFKRELAPPGL